MSDTARRTLSRASGAMGDLGSLQVEIVIAAWPGDGGFSIFFPQHSLLPLAFLVEWNGLLLIRAD